MAFRIPWSVFLIPKRKIPGSTSKNYSDSGGEKLELREELLSTPPSAKIRIVFQANSVQVATNKSSIVSQKMPGLICHRLEFKSSIVLNSMSKATQPFPPPPPPNPLVKGNGKTVMDSGFHAVESRFQVVSSLCQWNLDSEFQSLAGFWIPWAIFRILKSRIADSTSKKFPDSGIWIPLNGATDGLTGYLLSVQVFNPVQ